MQFFSQRKPKSAWSKINKEKVARLSAAGPISVAGLKAIETAIENGTKIDNGLAFNSKIDDKNESPLFTPFAFRCYCTTLLAPAENLYLLVVTG